MYRNTFEKLLIRATRIFERISPTLAEHADKVFILIAMSIFAVHLGAYWQYIVDDAYITFRYSRNFADGLGLVFNPNEKVEGFTSLVWTLWISLGIKLGADPMGFAKISGVVLSLGTLIYLGVRTHGLVALCLACSGIFTYWTVCGLETPLFVFALVVAMGELQRRKFTRSALILGFLPWIRPDGQLFTYLVFLPLYALTWWRARYPLKSVAKTLAALAIPMLILVLWRYSYYHTWQPNTYYAKVAMPWHDGFWKQLDLRGIPYVTDFWRQHIWLAPFVIWSFALSLWLKRRYSTYLHAALLIYQAYFAFVGGDWMYQFRWYAGVVPLYLMLCYPSLTWLYETARKRGQLSYLRYAAVGSTLALVMTGFHWQSMRSFIASGKLRYSEKHDLLLKNLGRQLAPKTDFDESILLGDIGLIGWESKLHVIDGAGLVDSYIAKLPAIHFWKSDLNYFLQGNPEWVLLRLHWYHRDPGQAVKDDFESRIADQPERLNFPSSFWRSIAGSGRWIFEEQLLGSEEFHARYSTVFVSPEFDQPQFLVLFCRQDMCDSERAQMLRQWSPNLGHVKEKLGRQDAGYYLQRTTEIIQDEEAAIVALGRKTHNREALRGIASSPVAPPWNKVEALTALGLDEYEWKEFHAAHDDFRSAVELGGRAPFHYSNVGWALKAMGRDSEAEKWFKKGK